MSHADHGLVCARNRVGHDIRKAPLAEHETVANLRFNDWPLTDLHPPTSNAFSPALPVTADSRFLPVRILRLADKFDEPIPVSASFA